MSKRSSLSSRSPAPSPGGGGGGGGANTLFKYFTKSPATPCTRTPGTPAEPASEEVKIQPKKLKLRDTSDREDSVDSDDEEVAVVRTRKRIRMPSDDSDQENEDRNNISITEKLEKYRGQFKTPIGSPASDKTKRPKLNASVNDTDATLNISKSLPLPPEERDWTHCSLDFLMPNKIKDKDGRRPDHPDYDPTTLYVPESFQKRQTPAHRQWWEMKSNHYDCVLFFKVGKFYELYHMDAGVGVNELGFSYMKGDFAHSGFPESAYPRMVSTLVQKGYKVARVEQTETPDMMQERNKKNNIPTKEKVVMREICQITCKGAEICGLQDNGPLGETPSYMFAFTEKDIGNGKTQYGICFIDTSIGTFHIGQFDDDKHSSRLLTALAHHPPALVLVERGSISGRIEKVLKIGCHGAKREVLKPEKQFWSAGNALKILAEKYYQSESKIAWPETFKPMLSESDSLGLTPKDEFALAIKAFGACLYYLTECLLDIQVMGMAQFVQYSPPDIEVPEIKRRSSFPTHMVLDGLTLHNLRITGEDGSLVSKLNHCTTPMGKRLIQQWVCSPSCNIEVIKERQHAITVLLDNQALVQEIRATFGTLPDMDRLLAKFHALGNYNRSQNHPDSRAILYEMKTYSKRKIIDFLSLLNGFKSAQKAMKKLADLESTLIQRLSQSAPQGIFPDYRETLKFFDDAFDHTVAQKEGAILPEKGVDLDYDNAIEKIADLKDELEDYRKKQEKYFGCKVVYFGSDKKRYQLEVPESKRDKLTLKYQLESSRKGFKRYSTEETREFLARMMAAEEHLQSILKDLSRRIFEKFSQSQLLWQKAIECITVIDVLISLTEYVRLQSEDMCVPEFVEVPTNHKAFISIKEGRHPCIPCMDNFIPNDTSLSAEDTASVVLLTGPNMGGKSTLMRQVGLIIVMAQIGCHVPATKCELSLVDRIFTRLGAHDDILTGQSTFLVELSETAAILKHATKHSLVLLDELGRGTSTFDGTAIAAAVLDNISKRGCRTMFSTHYHTLVDDFKNDMNISLAHMACMVEMEEKCADDVDSISRETVTFLYKLSPGACPKSYGFNAARLGGISKKITIRAHQVSIQLEKEALMITLFKKLCSLNPPKEFNQLLLDCKRITS